MAYSIDTNITIGILNPNDALHKRSTDLLNAKSNAEQLIIAARVLLETKTTFARKYNKACAEILNILKKLDEDNLDKYEYDSKFILEIDRLIKEKSTINGFIRLIYSEIKPFVERRDIPKCFKFLAKRGIDHSKNIERKISKDTSNNFCIGTLKGPQFKNLLEISNITQGIDFKDMTDREIFNEIVTYAFCNFLDLSFYTADNEFKHKGTDALNQLKNNTKYRTEKIKIKKLP